MSSWSYWAMGGCSEGGNRACGSLRSCRSENNPKPPHIDSNRVAVPRSTHTPPAAPASPRLDPEMLVVPRCGSRSPREKRGFSDSKGLMPERVHPTSISPSGSLWCYWQ